MGLRSLLLSPYLSLRARSRNLWLPLLLPLPPLPPLLPLLLLPLASCNKHYPSDIPGWVEDRIHECRKPFHDCNGLEILEYSGLGRRWFYFVERDNGSDELYDEGAALICTGNGMFIHEEQCSAVVLDSLHVVRSVWKEK